MFTLSSTTRHPGRPSSCRDGCVTVRARGNGLSGKTSWRHWRWSVIERRGEEGIEPETTTLPVIRTMAGSQVLQTFFDRGVVNPDYVEESFNSMANLLTNYLRTNSDSDCSIPARGSVEQGVTYLLFYRGYPSALVAAAIGFFVVLLTETRPRATGTVFGNPHRWLCCSMVSNVQDADSLKVSEVKAMQDFAKRSALMLHKLVDGVSWLQFEEGVR